MLKDLNELMALRQSNINEYYNILQKVDKANSDAPAKTRTSGGAARSNLATLIEDIVLQGNGTAYSSNQVMARLDDLPGFTRPIKNNASMCDKEFRKKIGDILWSLAGNTPKGQREKNPEAARLKYENRKIEKLGNGTYAARA